MRLAIWLGLAIAGGACIDGAASSGQQPSGDSTRTDGLVWERLTEHAAFPPGYNFPVFVARDGRFVALRSEGTWTSRDGVAWRRGALPWSGMNSAYLAYVEHGSAAWALGTLDGNYQRFTIDPVIRRTADYESWDVAGRSSTLPRRIFYAAASFRGEMWLLGGHDGTREMADVWRSTDGVTWRLAVPKAPWPARSGAKAIAFRDRLYLIGGGLIDGSKLNDVWSSGDGLEWVRETPQIAAEEAGGTPVVFRDRLWLVGANRTGRFSSAVLVTDDGRTWRPESAPWPPRGAVAAWVAGDTLYMTGGKYSKEERGETVFVYYNDVWRLRPAR